MDSESDQEKKSRKKTKVKLASYVLVQWLIEETYTVLLSSNVILGLDDHPIVGKNYKINYESKQFEAVVLKFGHKLECENQLNSICTYKSVEILKKRKIVKSDSESDNNNEMIDHLKNLIKERDEYIEELIKENNKLKNLVENKNLDFDNLSKSLNLCDKHKFINLAKSILTGLATTQDVLDLAVRSTTDDQKMVFNLKLFPEINYILNFI